MRLIGYSFDADMYCVECTLKRYPIPDESKDSEGNNIHPVFDIDEFSCDENCSDCRENLYVKAGFDQDCDGLCYEK